MKTEKEINYFCDVCGKEIPKGFFQASWNAPKYIYFSPCLFDYILGLKEYDICKDCAIKIKDFIVELKKEKEEKK